MRQLLCLIGTFFTALIIVVQAAPSKTDGVLVRRAYSGPGGLPFPFPTRTKPVANHDWDQSLQDIVRESTEMEDSLFYEWLFGRGVTTEAAVSVHPLIATRDNSLGFFLTSWRINYRRLDTFNVTKVCSRVWLMRNG